MNTRIQVEHTITEEVYGCDLVKEQIRIAAGEPLSEHVAHATPRLHAIECRINAEDPAKDFQPTPGRIDFYYAPGGRGVRIDSHVYTGYTVPPYYDSLIAKIITVGATRINAIERMRRALDEYYITGIKTTVPFHAAIMRNGEFRAGNYDTGFIERVMATSPGETNVSDIGNDVLATPRATVADFNGDGHPDYVLRNAGTRQTAIWYLNNNIFLSGALGPTIATEWFLKSAADFNLDSHPDYALFNLTTDQTAIWYMPNSSLVLGLG